MSLLGWHFSYVLCPAQESMDRPLICPVLIFFKFFYDREILTTNNKDHMIEEELGYRGRLGG